VSPSEQLRGSSAALNSRMLKERNLTERKKSDRLAMNEESLKEERFFLQQSHNYNVVRHKLAKD
jgi:hypothetical protein